MRKFPMPESLRHACELINCRVHPAQVLLRLVVCLVATASTVSSSSSSTSQMSAGTSPDSCNVEKCEQCNTVSRPARPYLRNALARSVYSRILVDEDFRKFDKSKWYSVRMDSMQSEDGDLFTQLDASDAETVAFLEHCQERSDAVFTQLFHLVARTVLSPFVSQTSINGLLRRGSMFVISGHQFRRLFRLPEDYRAARMLDLGAGDGATTALLASMFDSVHATEMSWPMQRILTARGFVLEDVVGWTSSQSDGYDVICALNLLDRCSKPLTLLEQIKKSLKPDGLVLIALAWPVKPYVEFSSDHRPEEAMPVEGSSVEEQAASLMRNVLRPAGFRVVAWSRIPYLCEGDLERTFYHLDDMIFALKVQ